MILNDWVNSADQLLDTAQKYLHWTLGLAFILLAVHWVNLLFFKKKLLILGVFPRRLRGLPGIIFSPFLHGDFSHLLFNLFPLFILTNLLLLRGFEAYCLVSVILIFMSGFLTWLLGRTAIHIGASSLILGYWGFLLMSLSAGVTITSVLTVFICLYYFGYFIFSLIPNSAAEEGQSNPISWEGHVFGLFSGVLLGYEWFIHQGRFLIWLAGHLGLG